MSTGDHTQFIPLGRQNIPQGPSARPPSSISAVPHSVEDAWPALRTASQAAFGDAKVLFFSTEGVADTPGSYTSRLTFVVPDGPERAFPQSPICPSRFDAMVSAVVLAVQAGALQHIMQWLPPRTFTVCEGKPEPESRPKPKPKPKPKVKLEFDRENPVRSFNAWMELFKSRAAQSWAFCALDDGYGVVLTIDLPSGRLIYGSPETRMGGSAAEAKEARLLRAFRAGLFKSLVANLRAL